MFGRRLRWTAVLGLLVVLLLFRITATAGPVLDRIRAKGEVVVAHREASIPFSYVDADGRPIGYAIDLCRRLVAAVSAHLKMPALRTRYLLVSSSTRIEAIEQGQADLGCESATNTAERRERVAFTIPHYVTGTRLVVRADSVLKELQDFRGHRLVSTTGTAPLRMLQRANDKRSLGIVLDEVSDHRLGIEAVASRAADGFAMDEVLLQGLVSARADPSDLKIVGKYLAVEALAIMLPKGDAEFKDIVDAEMKRLIRNREAHALHDQWFTRPIPPQGRNVNLPMPFLLRDSWRYPTDWVPDTYVFP
jgi:ABC-type amino acid transport substrate-binding protein